MLKELAVERAVRIPAGRALLDGDLALPPDSRGLVLFAHGSGSSRHSPRNQFVARFLQQSSFATLLMDLLTRAEEQADRRTGHLRFDIDLLANRLLAATDWAAAHEITRGLPAGYFGASTGAGAALVAAAARPEKVRAIVSRGGRPDLAGTALPNVLAPTLLIVGSRDDVVVELNEQAKRQMNAPVTIALVPGATHLFEEPGALEQVAQLAADWFGRHLERAGVERKGTKEIRDADTQHRT